MCMVFSAYRSLLTSEVTLELDTQIVEYGEEELRDRTIINHLEVESDHNNKKKEDEPSRSGDLYPRVSRKEEHANVPQDPNTMALYLEYVDHGASGGSAQVEGQTLI
uniref:Uncharacterized protein n=1 Tax=Tanacetum cinerariifolium TaxID=118510 RepID=A0A6L2JGB3_TANCI|nr:hypothetical protein [Tanacetum cinerariifolium]